MHSSVDFLNNENKRNISNQNMISLSAVYTLVAPPLSLMTVLIYDIECILFGQKMSWKL